MIRVLLLLLAGPLLVIALNAVKSPADYAGSGPLSIPAGLYLDGVVDFWNRVNFGQKLWNSFITSLAVAVLGVAYTAATGVSTLIGRWHRPSDAVAAEMEGGRGSLVRAALASVGRLY